MHLINMTTWGISNPFGLLSPSSGQVTNALLTRSPLRTLLLMSPFDLHVLGTPPAFILSQDQTLRQKTPFGVSLRIWCITIENDRASSSYHSSVVKVLIPRARFYSLYRFSSRLSDKNTDGPFLQDVIGLS
jgi:hypothetical protein